MRLHYIGAEWIPGVPASDFETDDPDTIRRCLLSDLYVEVGDENEAGDAQPFQPSGPAQPPESGQPAPFVPEGPATPPSEPGTDEQPGPAAPSAQAETEAPAPETDPAPEQEA